MMPPSTTCVLNAALTTEQRAAVESTAQWTSVQAGPGSGKTAVLAARIAYLLEGGARPEDIVAFAFTRAACSEIASRVHARVGAIAERVDITTFHAYAARRVVPAGFRVATDAEAEALLRGLYDGPTKVPARHLEGIETLRQMLVTHESDPGALRRLPVDRLIGRAREAMLVPTWDILPRLAAIADAQRRPWGSGMHVLVDEHQDCTLAEHAIASRIAGEALFTVGDPRQAIMGFRGAAGPDDLSVGSPRPTMFALIRTFRFGPHIASVANGIAARRGWGPIAGAEVDDSVTSAESIEEAVAAGADAILCRTNWECDAIARSFPGVVEHVRRDPLDPLSAEADRFGAVQRSGKIIASTVHGAKGREWDRVVVALDLESAVKDPEEDRVRYVAVTRARRNLTLVPPLPPRRGL